MPSAVDPFATAIPAEIAAPAVAPATVEPTTAPAEPRPSPTSDGPPVVIALAGDVHGEPPIDGVLRGGGNPVEAIASLLQDADIAVVNIETAIATGGTPANKQFTFRADPLLAPALADAGVDVGSLANNHALDFGVEAAAETAERLSVVGVAPVGFGADAEEAYAPALFEVRGRTVAVVGLSRVLPTVSWAATTGGPGAASAYDVGRAADAVRAAAALAEHVVVTIHWGRQLETCPNPDQLALADALVAAGADVIAGHHAHVLQGVERRDDGALVAWGLGNFVFYARTRATRSTGILTVELDDGRALGASWHPATIDGTGSPVPTGSPTEIAAGSRCGASG